MGINKKRQQIIYGLFKKSDDIYNDLVDLYDAGGSPTDEELEKLGEYNNSNGLSADYMRKVMGLMKFMREIDEPIIPPDEPRKKRRKRGEKGDSEKKKYRLKRAAFKRRFPAIWRQLKEVLEGQEELTAADIREMSGGDWKRGKAIASMFNWMEKFEPY